VIGLTSPDPADVVGSEVDVRVAFEKAFGTLDLRIRKFLALPLGQLKGRALVQELERIGGGTLASGHHEAVGNHDTSGSLRGHTTPIMLSLSYDVICM